jgi:hypothetical protein
MPDFSKYNPLAEIGIGKIGLVIGIFVGAIVLLAIIGAIVIWWFKRKQLKYTIPLYKKIGNRVIKVAVYKAKDFKIGLAGDKLWFVPKVKKYIPCGVLQTAPHEYSHFEREDGEWINVDFPDIDANMKKIGVKYVNSDMRSQRISISNIIDQRFANTKSWWEQYGHLVTYIIFYMIVAICMVVIFWQWGDIIDRTNILLDKIIAEGGGTKGVVPVFVPILWMGIKKKWK